MKTVSPYLSAEALGLKEEHRQALIGLADDLANHRIPDDEWRISEWDRCICGHLKKRTGVADKYEFTDSAKTIHELFQGYTLAAYSKWQISQEKAGKATYNYLTVGKPHWKELLSA